MEQIQFVISLQIPEGESPSKVSGGKGFGHNGITGYS